MVGARDRMSSVTLPALFETKAPKDRRIVAHTFFASIIPFLSYPASRKFGGLPHTNARAAPVSLIQSFLIGSQTCVCCQPFDKRRDAKWHSIFVLFFFKFFHKNINDLRQNSLIFGDVFGAQL